MKPLEYTCRTPGRRLTHRSRTRPRRCARLYTLLSYSPPKVRRIQDVRIHMIPSYSLEGHQKRMAETKASSRLCCAQLHLEESFGACQKHRPPALEISRSLSWISCLHDRASGASRPHVRAPLCHLQWARVHGGATVPISVLFEHCYGILTVAVAVTSRLRLLHPLVPPPFRDFETRRSRGAARAQLSSHACDAHCIGNIRV